MHKKHHVNLFFGAVIFIIASFTLATAQTTPGTKDRLVKWTDDTGTIGDSVVTDTGFLSIDSNNNPDAAGTGTLRIQGDVNKERIELRSAGTSPGPALQGRGFAGTIAFPAATQANKDLFIIGGSGHNGSNIVTFNAATIKIRSEEDWTGTANGAFINFETTPKGSPTSARIERMRITGSGNVGIGTINPQSKLDVNGQITTKVLQITGGADLAESFDINIVPSTDGRATPANVLPGMVVSIDAENPGKLLVSRRAYDSRVAGVVSGAGNIEPGMIMGKEGTLANGQYPVALTGRVYCWVDASYGAIKPGDLLTTSATPGYAMKATNRLKAQGAILGKAMTSLKAGKGLVLVLVTLQ